MTVPSASAPEPASYGLKGSLIVQRNVRHCKQARIVKKFELSNEAVRRNFAAID